MGIASTIIGVVGGIIDKAIPDKAEAERLKAEISKELLTTHQKELEAASNVIIAEASGHSVLQRNWRPVVMLVLTALVGAHWLGFTAPGLTEVQVTGLLDIVKVGLGGYVIGRSAEQVAKNWKR